MALKHQDIISKMSLEEKASLLSGKNFWETQEIDSLGIPSFFLSDGPNGLRKQAKAADHLGLNPSIPAVCMPTSATSASSWDPEILEIVGKTIGEEAAANDVSVLLGPGINMKRNPRCGRNFEYFSEDPYLAGKLAIGYVNGVQSNGIGACVKHFACNNQEIRRITSNSVMDERTLREIYLTAFEMTVKEAKPLSIMSSYNKLNGVYGNENQHLLKEILRDEWGFDGLVVSDWGGDNDRVDAVKAGSDLEMPTTDGETNREVIQAVKDGKLKEEEVDALVDRIIDIALKTTENLKKAPKQFDKDQHHILAQKVAEESLVLLKNKGDVLPLKEGEKIAIVGDFAFDMRYQGAGSSVVNPLKVDQIKDVIKEYPLNIVGYEKGFKRYGKKSQRLIDKALKLAEKADKVLVFIGLDEVTEAEGIDRANIRLPGNQRSLISALYDTGKKIILILECGAPIEMPFADRANAILHAYLPGEAGARAIMNVLTGKVNPSGKLAESYPYGYADCPSADHFGKNDKNIEYREGLFIGYRYYARDPIGGCRYSFGYGLSYTTFKYENLEVSDKGVKFTLTNTGKVDGKEIAEMYIGMKDSKIFRPVYELKGFTKVFLKAGESKEIFIPFDEYSFRYWDITTNKFETEKGTYQIYVGPSSRDFPLQGEIEIDGKDASGIYDKEKLPHYFSGNVRQIVGDEYKVLLGGELPPKRDVFVKKHRITVDYNSSISDLHYAKGFTGRVFAGAIRFAIKFLNKIGQRTTANTLVMGVYYNPVRALSRMTGGAMSMAQLDGLIIMFNGHFWKGLHHFNKMGRERKKLKKEQKKKLEKNGK